MPDMVLFELQLTPGKSSLTGKVLAPETVEYQIFGPFGSGYNIRVKSRSGSGLLRFVRDYPGASVKTPSGKYDMSADTAYGEDGKKVIELSGQSVTTESTDLLLLALFSMNHHFVLGTGPFLRI